MAFTTIEFLVFYVACAAAYFWLAHRFRWVLLLAASYMFYAAGEAPHVLILVAVSVAAYGAGLVLERLRDDGHRRIILVAVLTALLAPLFTYKYLAFVLGSVRDVLGPAAEETAAFEVDLLLPLGISFFTFQAIAYVIDVYKRQYPAERHLGMMSLYISFFPQLIAGPIERAGRLLPQFRAVARADPAAIEWGVRLMLWGAFKKLVIADNLAPYVDTVYGAPAAYTGLPLIVATVFFAFQIYCDFSAYIDIARGAARILGIELMRNFDRPYGAASIGEFWHRWHIALSTWFRDYVYVPLGGNRRGLALQSRNVLVVFLLSGLWHGANWTFVAWGGLHGLYLLAGLWTAGLRRRLAAASGLERHPAAHRVLQLAVTFALVSFGWIFFRAESMADAIHIVTHLFQGVPAQLAGGDAVAALIIAAGGTHAGFWTLVAMTSALFIGHAVPEGAARRALAALEAGRQWLSWSASYALAVGCLFYAAGDDRSFIYFRF